MAISYPPEQFHQLQQLPGFPFNLPFRVARLEQQFAALEPAVDRLARQVNVLERTVDQLERELDGFRRRLERCCPRF